MCYPQTPATENANEDVFDLLIFEPEREEIEIALQFTNSTFNNAFVQIPLDAIPIQEYKQVEQPLESIENAYIWN